MTDKQFPDLIMSLPEADIPFAGVRGWLAQAADRLVVFFDIEPIGEVPPHRHGEHAYIDTSEALVGHLQQPDERSS